MNHRHLLGFSLLPLLLCPLGLMADGSGEAAAETGIVSGQVVSRLTRTSPAVVYLEKVEGLEFSPPAEPTVMDQRSLIFIPHVLPVVTGTTVDFPNSDSVRHSVFTSRKSAQQFNLGTYPAGEVKSVVMEAPGKTTLLCNVHAEMSAYLIVVETPYFATTDQQGRFSIEGVPPGDHRLSVWHEKLKGETKNISVRKGETTEVLFENLRRQ